MKKNSIGLPVIGAMAIAMGLGGCADENPWGNTSSETGSINVTLTTDYGFATAKPVFRSGEETRAEGDANDLATYITLPSIDDFKITLTKQDGTEQTWSTFSQFEKDIKTTKFASGIYTLTASKQGYDETEQVADGQQPTPYGFNCYHFEGSTKFTVIPNKTTDIDLTAELKNSMVKINFDQTFIDYVDDGFTAYVRNSTGSKLIPFVKNEERTAFIDPSTAELSVNFTTKVTGKTQEATVKIGEFEGVAKTLHNITLAIDNTKNGFAQLTVEFDETLSGKDDVTIDLTKELYDTPAPEITCIGFKNQDYIDLLTAGENSNYSMTVTAPGGMKKAELTITGMTPAWGQKIDLCTADATQLENGGITIKNFKEGETVGTIDFTQFVKNLSTAGEYSVMLTVEDTKGRTYEYTNESGEKFEGVKVTFNNKPVVVKRIKAAEGSEQAEEEKIVYGSNTAVVYMEYNGDNIENLTFTANDANGTSQKATVTKYEDLGTRALENKLYRITLALPYSTGKKATVTARYNNQDIETFNIPVKVPEYTITANDVDAFSKYAYIRVKAASTDIAAVVNNLKFTDFSKFEIVEKNSDNYILVATELTKSTSYTLKSTITNGEEYKFEDVTFTTEEAQEIPNGDFSLLNDHDVKNSDINSGGPYRNTAVRDYHNTSSFDRSTPKEWSTINSKTAWSSAKTQNTWFVVPSSWGESAKYDGKDVTYCLMRNVGYHPAGTEPGRTGGALNTTYYNTNAPSDLKHAPGEVFLGTYSYDYDKELDDKTEGITFKSRPSSISFEYIYAGISSDNGYVKIAVLDDDDNVIGTASDSESSNIPVFTNGTSWETKTIAINYPKFKKSSSYTLIVGFKSSNQGDSAPINIPSGSKLDDGCTTTNRTIATNNYSAVATGSILKITNVKANYEIP